MWAGCRGVRSRVSPAVNGLQTESRVLSVAESRPSKSTTTLRPSRCTYPLQLHQFDLEPSQFALVALRFIRCWSPVMPSQAPQRVSRFRGPVGAVGNETAYWPARRAKSSTAMSPVAEPLVSSIAGDLVLSASMSGADEVDGRCVTGCFELTHVERVVEASHGHQVLV